MERAEFLNILKSQLSGQMPEWKIDAHIRYYQDYIQSQVKSGKNENTVLDTLGDPRLIAKTLIDTAMQRGEVYEDSQECYSGDGTEYSSQNGSTIRTKKWKLDLHTWYGKLAVVLIAGLAIFLFVTLLTVAIPFVLILFIVLYLISQWKKRV